ncbi:hypothetical protein Fmac_006440 [Flemingia macrophylla]|uniref:DYW domain-containing protein n=1 Tax=Flemingia macrophylla TaxID=520843 RepID=A0ABD1NDB3_9FABA
METWQWGKTLNPFLSPPLPKPPSPWFRHKPSTLRHATHPLLHALHLSSISGDPLLAKTVHATLLKHQHDDTHLSTALIAAYLKLRLFPHALRLFHSLSSPNVVSYTALISALAHSHPRHALHLFLRMTRSHLTPNDYTYVAVLTACARSPHFQLGLQLHAAALKTAHFDSAYVANSLIALYATHASFLRALRLFRQAPNKDSASWNTLISSAVRECLHDTAFRLFREMQANGTFRVDDFTLSILLSACSSLLEGQQVHGLAVKLGFETGLNVGNGLVGFYTKYGRLDEVEWLFEGMRVRDVITWTQMVTAYMEFGLLALAFKVFGEMPERNSVSYNALLSGLSQNGEGLEAMKLFIRMVEEGLELTAFTLTSGVHACGLLGDYRVCRQVHGLAVKFGFGFGSNACVEVALLDMYTRCGRMADAEKMFLRWELEEFSSVAWTSMICCYARDGKPLEAFSLFRIGRSGGKLTMDEVVAATMLGLCGTVGHLDMGKEIHCHVVKCGLGSNLEVGNALVSMYFKCGSVDDAMMGFNDMPCTDVVTWNTLISGNLMHRQGDRALEIWVEMQQEGIKPDQVTFVLIISAYRQTETNLVDDCRSLFNSMRSVYQIEPTSEHYASFISVLGHWGFLQDALETIYKMPFKPSALEWRALLDGCRLHKNAMIEKWAAQNILSLEPKDPSTFILVSNLYSASGRWDRSEMVRESMREKGFRKHPVQSWIISQKKIHTFYPRDRSHPQEKDVYRGLEILILECLKVGYEPDTSFVRHEVEEHHKKTFLFHHSAKLAATYGILMTKPGKPVRLVKNILLCGDCHEFLKYASIVTKREIFLRDSSGFHCFSSGQCSCKDCW